MAHLALYILCICVAFQFTQAIHIEQVFVIKENSTNGNVYEDVTLDIENSSPKNHNKKNINVKYTIRTPNTKPPAKTIKAKRKWGRKSKKHRHLRRRCCEAGVLSGKHGFSCIIPRNYRTWFFNLITIQRLKVDSVSQRHGARGKFQSKKTFHIYRKVSKCVKRQMKSVVQKCCVGYRTKQRRWHSG